MLLSLNSLLASHFFRFPLHSSSILRAIGGFMSYGYGTVTYISMCPIYARFHAVLINVPDSEDPTF